MGAHASQISDRQRGCSLTGVRTQRQRRWHCSASLAHGCFPAMLNFHPFPAVNQVAEAEATQQWLHQPIAGWRFNMAGPWQLASAAIEQEPGVLCLPWLSSARSSLEKLWVAVFILHEKWEKQGPLYRGKHGPHC